MRLASATMVPVLHAEGLGFVAGGDAAGGVGHHGDDADGTAAQLGPDLLLDRGEVGVEIDEEPVEQRTPAIAAQPDARPSGSGARQLSGWTASSASSSGHSSGADDEGRDWAWRPSSCIYFRLFFAILQCKSSSHKSTDTLPESVLEILTSNGG